MSLIFEIPKDHNMAGVRQPTLLEQTKTELEELNIVPEDKRFARHLYDDIQDFINF